MRVQYEGLVEPVSISGETVTEDRWQGTTHQPWRPAVLTVACIATIGCLCPTGNAENVSEDRWHQNLPQPARPAAGLRAEQQRGSWPVPQAAENVSEDRWHFLLPQPVRKSGLSPYLAPPDASKPLSTSPESVSEDRFHFVLPQPARPAPGLAGFLQPFRGVYPESTTPETVTAERWAFLPPPVFPRSWLTGEAFAFPWSAVSVTAEIVTLDKWYQGTSVPARARNSAPEGGFFRSPSTSAETVTEDRWHYVLPQPWRKSGLAPYLAPPEAFRPLSTDPESVSEDRFHFSLPQPSRPGFGLRAPWQVGAWALPTTAESVTADRFGFAPPQPTRPAFGLRGSLQPVGAFWPLPQARESVTADRWAFLPPLVQPARHLTGEQFAFPWGSVTATPPETVTLDKWYRPASEPVRAETGAPPGGLCWPASQSAETASEDRWHFGLPQPERPAVGVRAEQQRGTWALPTTAETVSEDRFHFVLPQPPRPAVGLSARYQVGAWALPTVGEGTSADRWQGSLVQPAREIRRAAESAAPFLFTPVPAFAETWAFQGPQPERAKKANAAEPGTLVLFTSVPTVDGWLFLSPQPDRTPRFTPPAELARVVLKIGRPPRLQGQDTSGTPTGSPAAARLAGEAGTAGFASRPASLGILVVSTHPTGLSLAVGGIGQDGPALATGGMATEDEEGVGLSIKRLGGFMTGRAR